MMHRILALFIMLLIISHRYFQASDTLFQSCCSSSNIPARDSGIPKITEKVSSSMQTIAPSITLFIWQGKQKRQKITQQEIDELTLFFGLFTQEKTLKEYQEQIRIKNERKNASWSDVSDSEVDKPGEPGWDKVHETESSLTSLNHTPKTPLAAIAAKATRRVTWLTEKASSLLSKQFPNGQ